MRKAKPGDVVEIETEKGHAYALVTHHHTSPPRYGHLIRVFEGFHRSTPENLEVLVSSPIQFSTFFPLDAAVRAGLVKIVGNVPVPAALAAMPKFRVMGLLDPHTKKASKWGLWEGKRTGGLLMPLSAQDRKLPILEVVNDTMLVERIASGWRPELDIHT